MAFNSDISEKWVLVIDDLDAMRAQLRMSLAASGFAKLHVVGSIKEALERMEKIHYDLILCDYALGDGTDGQQFLEYLRTNDLITRNTIFVMITAEQKYQRVVAASECAPDDYVLKPFTAAEFNTRIEKLLERQQYFSAVDAATDTKNWGRVIAECDKKLAIKDKYIFDLFKIKCSALMRSNRAQEAANLYEAILAQRPIGWAKLGLARALQQLNRLEEAKSIAQEIMQETPHFMAAYDFLGKLLAATGEKQAALNVLQKAREVSPGTMSRVREMSTLAISAGQPEMAEEVMRQALHKHKHSPVRQATDYAVLSKALVNQGKTTEALSVVADAQKSFRDDHSTIVLSSIESVAHVAAGNTEKAATSLARAMSFGDLSKLPPNTVIALADACFVSGNKEDATKLLDHVIQNNQEDEAVKSKVHESLILAGKDPSEANAMIEASTKEVIQLNNEGVRKAEAGQLEESIAVLCQAADRLPNNMQIVGNAALVIALDLVRNGNKPDKLRRCMQYRTSLQKKSPTHPKLAQIDAQLKQLTQGVH